MRFYAVADIHAKPERLDRIRAAVRQHAPDLLVVAGDIVNYIHPHTVFRRLNALGIPVLAVRGNSDLAWHERCFQKFDHITSLHNRSVEFKGCAFAGISGTLPLPFRTRLHLCEKDLVADASRFVCPETILAVHPPPFGTCDRVAGRFNAGSRGVARIIAHCTPRVVVCGHIHEDPGVARIGNTLVINCSIGAAGNGTIVDIDDSDPAKPPSAIMI